MLQATMQSLIDRCSPGTYELRKILQIPADAACPGGTGVRIGRLVDAGDLAHIRHATGLGPNQAHLYEIY